MKDCSFKTLLDWLTGRGGYGTIRYESKCQSKKSRLKGKVDRWAPLMGAFWDHRRYSEDTYLGDIEYFREFLSTSTLLFVPSGTR